MCVQFRTIIWLEYPLLKLMLIGLPPEGIKYYLVVRYACVRYWSTVQLS